MPPSPRCYFSLGLLTMAVIAYELTLIQVFSITQWYHFAYMVISVAMLGFGAAGTFLALFEKRLLARFSQAFSILLFLSGACMAMANVLAQAELARFDTYLLFSDSRQAGRLLLTYLLFFTPFFLAALAIGLAFVRFSRQIGQLYFADLLGSGLGGLLGLALLWHFLPGQLTGLIALLPLVAGILSAQRPWSRAVMATAALSFLLVGAAIPQPARLQPSQYKSISATLLLPEAKVETERSSPHGLIQVVSSPALRYAPALSLAYQGSVPVRKAIFNNGEWVGALNPAPRPDSVHMLDFTTGALPYRLRRPEKALILNAGAGEQLAHALANGVGEIAVVEANPVILSLLRNELAAETDSLLFRPGVRVYELEARTFLMADTSAYGLIVLPMTGTFGGGAGLNAMQEQYLLTIEAFREMWNRLGPDGMIAVSCWMDYPARNPLKILATLMEVLQAEGIRDARQHLAAARSWGTVTFLLKKSPLSAAETARARAFCREMLFDPLILGGLRPEERQQYNEMQDPLFFEYIDTILSPGREAFYDAYDFNVRPATDNRPYFSQFLRWASLPALAAQWSNRQLPFLEAGYLVVVLTFVQILLTALVLILAPLFRIGFRGGQKRWSLLYFGSLGLGYMFIEIVLIQQFILFFGKPAFATAAVISGLLIASGAGSWYSSRLALSPRRLRLIAWLIALLVVLYAGLARPLLLNAVALGPGAKLTLLLLLTSPIGFLMGMPFPLGIRLLSEKRRGNIPWAWGVNGFLSVISAALATIIATELGFRWVMALAAAAYILAGIVSSGRALRSHAN